MKKTSLIVVIAMICSMFVPVFGANTGSYNVANQKYLQDFEGITDLSEVGFNPGNISNTDTTKVFVLGSTTEKGNGLAVNYTAGSSTKSIVAPGANTTYGFCVDAASFETAGKEIEYGYDIYIPGGAYKAEKLAGYLVLTKEDGSVIQYCSELPGLTNTNNTAPNLKFQTINDESLSTDWTGNNNVFTANGKPGVDQANNSVYVDYAETENGGWVSVKSRLSYVTDDSGKGYYVTKYYINGDVVRNSNKTPVKFKVEQNLAPASSGRKYLQFSLWGNNGENNPNKLIVDNIFANVVDAEEEEKEPETPTPTPPTVNNTSYYYQDFEGFNGDLSALNYSSNDESVGTLKTSEKYGNGMYSNYKASSGTKDITAKNLIELSTEQFEDKENAVIALSYDMYIPSSLVGNRMVNTYVNFYDASGNLVKYASMLPTLRSHVTEGTMYFMGSDKTDDVDYATYNTDIQKNPSYGTNWILYDGNCSYSYTPTKSEWVNVLTLLSYENGYYVSRFYVNGAPVTSKVTQEPAVMCIKDNDVADKRKYIGFYIQERSGAEAKDDQGILFDNIAIRMSDGITIDKYMQVAASSGNINIPIYNGSEFTEKNVPDYIKKAMLKTTEIKPEDIIIEKFAQDDKFLLNGEVVGDYRGTLNDATIELSEVEKRENNENLKVTLKNIKSVDDKELTNSTIFIAADENFTGITNSRFENINGEDVKISSADSVPTVIGKIELTLQNVTSAVITGGGNTYTATKGVFDFKDNPLKPNTTYEIKLNGNNYATFKTVNEEKLLFSDITVESNTAKVKYVNTFADGKTVYLMIMYFDSTGNLVKVSSKSESQKSIAGLSSSEISATVSMPTGATYYKVAVLDGLETANPLTDIYVNPTQTAEAAPVAATNEIEVYPFDNNKKAEVKGVLPTGTKGRITAVLTDANKEIVYANDMVSANDGSYLFNINMPDNAETGTYKLYVAADGKLLANGTNVYYSKDSSGALGLVNGASTIKEMTGVIESNRADLEFFYDEYYTLFDDSDKEAVAELILNEKNKLKTQNDIGFVTNDKKASTDAFRKAVTVRAVYLGKVDKYSEVESYFDELLSGTVYNWINHNGSKNIRNELKTIWQKGVLSRLKGAEFTSFDDFVDKIKAALLFECIGNSDGYGNIQSILGDYVSQNYINGLANEYLTNTVCSKLVNKVYQGFEYTNLINDIKGYYNAPTNDNKVTGGGGVGGGFSANKPVEPIEKEEIKNDTVEYDTFRDISDSWAKDIIIEMAQKNIISGVGDDCFAPERNITREEFVAIIVRAFGLSEIFDAELPFSDVNIGDWYYDVVRIAYQNGIINGKSTNEFGTGENISRQDMAVILKNVMDINKIAYENSMYEFADSDTISDYALSAISVLSELSIINGYEDNTFRPNGLATRAEAAKVVYESLSVLNK